MRSKSQQSGHSSFLLAISCADSGSFVGDPRGPHIFEPHIQPWGSRQPWQGLGLPADGRGTGTASCAAREGVASGMAARLSGNAGTCWNPEEILNLEEPGELGLALRIFEEFHAFPEVEVAYLQIMGCLVVVVYSNCAGLSVS